MPTVPTSPPPTGGLARHAPGLLVPVLILLACHGLTDSGTGSVALTPSAPIVLTNQTVQFTVGPGPQLVSWSASAGSIDQNGLFTAPAMPGTLIVTATRAIDSSSVSTVVTVAQIEITIEPGSGAVLTDKQLQLSAQVTGWPDTSVTWSASAGRIDENGLLTAPATPGPIVVAATSMADTSRSASTTVDVRELAIAVAPRVVAVPEGEWLQLTAMVTGWTDASVTWSVLESVGCGAVVGEDVYLAPRTAPTTPCHVVAVSNADPAKSAIAEVTVGVRAYPEADATSLRALLGARILGAGGATEEIRANLSALVPQLTVSADAAKWSEEAAALRKALLDRVVFAGRAAAWRDASTRVEWLDWIDGGPEYRIRKMRYEALPGLWIPGLLYMPDNISQTAPAMLHLIGHWPEGKAERQLQTRAISLAKHGVIGLSIDWYWTGELGSIDSLSGNNHGRLHQIGLTGASGLAPFYLAVSRAIDALESLPEVDPRRIGVTGASGGGWQSIWIGALDERVALVNPVAGFSALSSCMEHYSDIGDSEQLPVDMGTVADFTHLAALVAPRPLLLTYNAYDECCFRADYALEPLFDAALAAYQVYGVPDTLRTHVNYSPGTHNFERDNRQQLYRLIGDYFFPGDTTWDSTESDVIELKTAAELNVDLPLDNGNLHRLVVDLAASLPTQSPTPSAVGDVVHAHVWSAERATTGAAQLGGDVAVRSVVLRVGGQWTVPAVELTPTDPLRTAIVIDDWGRPAAATEVTRLLAEGNRVLVVDPFGYGESYMPGANLMALTSTLGERPLGLAVSQVAAIARLIAGEQGGAASTLVALGPQASMVAMVAGVLEPQAIGALDLQGALASLRSLLELDVSLYGMRFVWCQGLLEVADVDDLVALVSPRTVTFR